MDKTELRKTTMLTLKNMPASKKKTAEQILTKRLLESALWENAETIGITMAQGFEWDTKPIIEAAWDQKKNVAVPKCIPEQRKLVFYKLTDFSQLEVVYYQLLEPNPEETMKIDKQKIDLLIVPGIAYDKKGYRIGFGGGYYDRFLADFSGETVSLVHTMQLTDYLPSEAFDIPVRNLMTEHGPVVMKG